MTNELNDQNSILLIIDVQEKLIPTIYKNDELLEQVKFAIKGFKALNLPVLVTEQYPNGLGQTVPEIKELIKGSSIFEKTEFSAWQNEYIKNALNSSNKQCVILLGIEAHICVYQTATDLVAHGYQVFVPEEAIGSSQKIYLKNAKKRMINHGITMTNTESCFFEIMKHSKHPSFKAISSLLKEKNSKN